MTTLKDTPLRIPDSWDAQWFRRFVVEVLDKADFRGYVQPDVPIEIASHNLDPLAHGQMVAIHNIDLGAHPSLVSKGTATVADATDSTDVITRLNELLAILRANGTLGT